jgi:colanic acid/amylovoran biosynthesis protein
MKILVVNGFITEAIGDAALLSVILEQLSAAFPNAEIRVSTLDDPVRHPYFDGYLNLGSSRRYGADESVPRAMRAARKLAVSLIGSHWPTRSSLVDWLLPREVRRELVALREADLVVSVGGGYLYGGANLSGDLSILNMLMPLRYAGRMGKPFFCGPQSYGPFGSRRQAAAAQRTLSKADLLLAREAESLKVLAHVGIDPARVIQTIDSAFAFRPGNPGGWRTRYGAPDGQTLVGMTVRQWKPAPGLQEAQEIAFAQLIDHIHASQGRDVILIPMVVSDLAGEDDRVVHRRIADRCVGRRPILVEDQLGHGAAKDLIAAVDYMVGMRFHSVIFALTNLVPALAIEYHHKAGGIMSELELKHWVLGFDDLSGAQLIATFDRMVSESDVYRKRLAQAMPEVIQEASQVTGLMRSAYTENNAGDA